MNAVQKKPNPRLLQGLTILMAGFLIQVVLGGVYAWSGVGQSLKLTYNWPSFQIELIFGLCIGIFALGTIATGRLIHTLGPRLLGLISAILFAAAYLLAWLSQGNYSLILIALGPVLGLATAFGYVCPLSVAVQWFPHHKGLVTGLSVAGFGGGAIINTIALKSLAASSSDILNTLLFMGLISAFIIAASATILRFPPKKPSPKAVPVANHHATARLPAIREPEQHFFRTGLFWSLCIAMFLGTFGGLIVIGSVVPLSGEFGFAQLAPFAQGLVAAGNALGRLFWGAMVDRFGTRAIFVSYIISAGAMLLLVAGPVSPVIFLVAVFFIGMQFGACLVVFATFTEKVYGPGAIARVYPLIFAWYGLAAIIGPPSGGLVHQALGSYLPVIMTLVIMPLAGFLVLKRGTQVLSHQ